MGLEVVVGGEILEEVTLLLHDAVELVEVDLAIAITASLVDHVLELLLVDVLTHLAGHHLEELSELDGAVAVVVNVRDHLLELLLLDLEPEGAHGGLELTDIDGARVIGIEKVEGLADLLDLLLGETSLGLLLGGTTARHIL